MRPSRVGLALVLVAATVLRYWDLGHGIPHAIGTEEPQIVGRAFQMMSAGTYNPRFFDYGQLHITLQLAVSVVRFMAGATAGEWYSLAQATPAGFYLWGRALVAAFGVATVLLVFQIGMRWGARHALMAAAFVAVAPAHVAYSQLAVPDVLLTFLVALVMALSLSASEKGTILPFALAGAAAGLAAGTRYVGALALVMPLVACWTSPVVRQGRMAVTASILGAAIAGFFGAAPFTVIELPGFLDRLAQLAAEARRAAPAGPGGILDALEQYGWPAVLLMAVGVGMAAVRSVRGPGRARWAVALSFLLAYAAVAIQRRAGTAREFLPLLPMLSVLAATAVISGVSVLRRYEFPRGVRSGLIALLTLAVLAPALFATIRHNRDRSKQTTQDLAYSWIQQHVRPDSVVVVEASALTLPRDVVSGHGIGELRAKTAQEYSRDGVQYLVASSAVFGKYMNESRTYRQEFRDYSRLFSETREVARFAPSARHPGPELRILQVAR